MKKMTILERFKLKKLPSETYDCYWLGCEIHPDYETDYPKDTENGGKWLIFRSKERVDNLWFLIRLSTTIGFLGNKSKVSTAYATENRKSHVICVYTYDSNDKKDVKRIRKELKNLGIKEVIRYKTNKSTLEGKYANKGFKNISKYES